MGIENGERETGSDSGTTETSGIGHQNQGRGQIRVISGNDQRSQSRTQLTGLVTSFYCLRSRTSQPWKAINKVVQLYRHEAGLT
jgi:hypothetical protein